MKKSLSQIVSEEIEKFFLKEFMQPSFNWDEFNQILENSGTVEAKEYCIEHLGEPIGQGTSRAVFEIDDYTVLKLSLSKDDIEQNLHEFEVYRAYEDNPLLPRIYGHSDDYTWLWAERVLPCTHEDFEKILGIPYNISYKRYSQNTTPNKENEVGYDEYNSPNDLKYQIKDEEGDDTELDFMRFLIWWPDYKNDWEDLWDENEKQTFREWLTHPWIQHLVELFNETEDIGEFFDDNFGIAIRNGKPTIVVLDIGY